MKLPSQDSFIDTFYIGAYNRFQITDKDTIGIQNIWTPIIDLEETTGVLFKDYINPDMKNIAVLFNFEFFWSIFNTENLDYYNNIKFTYFYDSEFDKYTGEIFFKRIKKIYNLTFEYELISIEKFSDTKDIKDLNEAMSNKHFDIIFSNPPYNHNLDLKILQTVFNYTDKAVFIHPAGYLFDKSFNTNIYNDIRNTNYLEEVNFFFGNKIFDIGLFLPMCISVWNTEKTSDTCKVFDEAIWKKTYLTKINDISYHNPDMYPELTKLKNTVSSYSLMINNRVNNPTSDWNIFISPIKGQGGHPGPINPITKITADMFTIVTKDISKSIVDKNFKFKNTFSESAKFLWSFNTEKERNNCLNYLKTKIIRFLLSYTKINQHLGNNMNLIPWMDFTQDWNDKKLWEEFNISKEFWEYIDKFIPDYYDDYKSGF